MDLKSGYPFRAIRNGLMHAFPTLDADLRRDVAVVGGGITGALIARGLVAAGHSVAILGMRDVGCGSTALLQDGIDEHLVDLCKRYGEADAPLAHRACSGAIDGIEQIPRDVRGVDFERCDSLYYASKRRYVRPLQEEMDLRIRD